MIYPNAMEVTPMVLVHLGTQGEERDENGRKLIIPTGPVSRARDIFRSSLAYSCSRENTRDTSIPYPARIP